MEAALMSETKMAYTGGVVPAQTTPNDEDRTSIISGFSITTPGNKRPRKSTFLTQGPGEATVFSSVMNLVNTVIGAGILGLPQCMSHTGWALGVTLLVLFGASSIVTLHLQMIAAHTLRTSHTNIRMSYLTMCENTVPRLRYLVDLSVGITCFGICSAYLVVIGDLMPDVCAQLIDKPEHELNDFEKVLESRQLWIVVFLVVFIIPTVRLRNLDALRFTSTAAIACFAYITVIVVLYAFVDSLTLCDPETYDPARYEAYCVNNRRVAIPFDTATDTLKFFKAAPVVIFAYGCHQNAFTITNELRVASKSNMNQVSFAAITVCCIIYCLVAYSGYHSFGESAPSNLLLAYPRTTPFLIVRICLSLAVSFSYPVLNHPGRNSFSSLFFNVADATELNWVMYNGLSWTIVVLSFIIAMVTDDLGMVLGVVGATGTTIIAFVLPGLFYYYMPDKTLMYNRELHYKRKKYLAMTMTVIGCILMPFSVAMQFVSV